MSPASAASSPRHAEAEARHHLDRVLHDLSRPAAFPERPEHIEVVQTHASAVFLTPTEVFKVKKPVDFGFLDYSTLDRRHTLCALEVSLNRRLAPDVYRGVVPITEGPDGHLRIGGEGEPLEWAVHMRRLPEEATLRSTLQRGDLTDDDLAEVGRRLARFHARAHRDLTTTDYGRFDLVAANALDNLEAMRDFSDALGSDPVARLERRTRRALDELQPLIEARASDGVPCAIHGDLRLEHLYRFPDADPPDDLVVIDGIEFNEAFRMGDPVSDLAFLSMDLRAYGAWGLARALEDAWIEASDDPDARRLLPLYVSYRSAVRAKVALLQTRDPAIGEGDRAQALVRARRHTVLALSSLLPPRLRPRLLLTAGLPGTGKTTLARALAAELPLTLLRTDVIRKELAGLDPTEDASSAADAGLYSPPWSARTYDHAAVLAEAALLRGQAVLVDGSFRRADLRRRFCQIARRTGVPFLALQCEVPEEVAKARILARTGDASDADATIYDHLAARFEPVDTAHHGVHIDTTRDDAAATALHAILAHEGVDDGDTMPPGHDAVTA